MEVNRDTWVISDHHYGHRNILKYADRDVGFEEMWNRWQDAVPVGDDPVLHLGDLIWHRSGGGWYKHFHKAHGKVYLVPGNHDRTPPDGWEKIGVTKIKPFVAEVDGKRIMFSHKPQEWSENCGWDLNVHGHIHINPYPSYCKPELNVWFNVSVEKMAYRPQRLGDVLDRKVGNGILDVGTWQWE